MANRLDVYQREDNRWGWRLIAGNGRIIATDGSQGYENRADCEAMGAAIVSGAYAPPVEASLRCEVCGAELAGEGGRIEHMPDGSHTWAPNPSPTTEGQP